MRRRPDSFGLRTLIAVRGRFCRHFESDQKDGVVICRDCGQAGPVNGPWPRERRRIQHNRFAHL